MSGSRSPRPLLDADGQDLLARRLLRAGRADRLAPKRATSLVAGAIAAASASSPAGAAVGNGNGVTTSGSWTKVIAALVPVIGLVAVSYSITPAPAPAPAVTVQPAPLATPVAPATPFASSGLVVVPPTVAGPGDLPDAKDRPAAPTARESKPAAHAKHAGEGTFEAELALLTQVTSALQDKQPSRALALIDEHDRRFPSGTLAPEFAGERVLTLAALGRQAEACAQSAKFLAKYPKSPFVPEVRSSCVDPTSNR